MLLVHYVHSTSVGPIVYMYNVHVCMTPKIPKESERSSLPSLVADSCLKKNKIVTYLFSVIGFSHGEFWTKVDKLHDPHMRCNVTFKTQRLPMDQIGWHKFHFHNSNRFCKTLQAALERLYTKSVFCKKYVTGLRETFIFYLFFILLKIAEKEGEPQSRKKRGFTKWERGSCIRILNTSTYSMHFWAQKQVNMYTCIHVVTKFFLYQNSLGFLIWIYDKYAHLFQKI